MVNPDGSPNTAHTTNPVPIILVDPEIKQIHNGIWVISPRRSWH
jgi:2,3-bisphosphoglycerate-independent phosphoglycerate mutase